MPAAPRFRMGRLDHVHIRVPDRAEAARWYAEHLGFEPVDAFEFWATGFEGGPLQISADGGRTTLALFEASDGHPMVPQQTGVAFSVGADRFVSFARSLPCGIDGLSGEPLVPGDLVDFDLCWAFELVDPWGNRYELNCYDYGRVRAELVEADGIEAARRWPRELFEEARSIHGDRTSDRGASPPTRLAPLRLDELDDQTRAVVESAGDLNIFTTLAHHPELLRRWLRFGSHVLVKSTLTPRAREIVILRTGWRCGSEYEFGQHTLIGAQAGLADEEIARLATDGTDGWSASDAVLVRAADELVDDHMLSDITWDALGEQLSTEQILDVIFTVGQYALVSSALRSLGVQREDGVPGWPS